MPRRMSLRARTMLSRLAWLSAVGLALFHGWLLWCRVSHPASIEPRVVLRWMAGLGLLGVLVALRRLGVPLLWGRKALAFWMLVFLLHWSASAPPTEEAVTIDPSEQLLLALPGTLSLAAVVSTLLLALATAKAQAALARPGLVGFVLLPFPLRLSTFSLAGESPRPPPVSSTR